MRSASLIPVSYHVSGIEFSISVSVMQCVLDMLFIPFTVYHIAFLSQAKTEQHAPRTA